MFSFRFWFWCKSWFSWIQIIFIVLHQIYHSVWLIILGILFWTCLLLIKYLHNVSLFEGGMMYVGVKFLIGMRVYHFRCSFLVVRFSLFYSRPSILVVLFWAVNYVFRVDFHLFLQVVCLGFDHFVMRCALEYCPQNLRFSTYFLSVYAPTFWLPWLKLLLHGLW